MSKDNAWQQVYRDMIKACKAPGIQLDAWERTAIKQLEDRMFEGNYLSQRQVERLEQIHDRVVV